MQGRVARRNDECLFDGRGVGQSRIPISASKYRRRFVKFMHGKTEIVVEGKHGADASKVTASGPAFNDALCAFNTKIETDLLSNASEIAAPKLMKKLIDIYFTRVTQATCRILVILRSSKNNSEMWVGMLEKTWMEYG
ncbi:hypothetical protein Tco_1117264 [Tanacetum coccineum]